MCQGFSHFSGFLHLFVLTKLAMSCISFKYELEFLGTLLISQMVFIRCSFMFTTIGCLFSNEMEFIWFPYHFLTLPMLRLLSSKTQGRKDFWKSSKPCLVGINWIALAIYSLMSTYVPGFSHFSLFFSSFCIGQI